MYEFLDKRYALALYDVAEKKGKAEEFIEDFEDIVNLLIHNKDCNNIISHPQISTKEKRDLFIKMFKDKIDDELLSFLLILIDKGRIKYAEEKLIEMKKIHFQRQDVLKVEIKTVIPLEDEDKLTLIANLEKKYNKKIRLIESIDKSIIGGVFLKIGEDLIDGTIKFKLDSLREYIINREEE